MEYRQHLKQKLIESEVPFHVHEGIIEYLTARRPVGHFLKAVLSNDLMEAVHRADEEMALTLARLVKFLAFFAPANSWGSASAYQAWISEEESPSI
jgi:hypothetical protein